MVEYVVVDASGRQVILSEKRSIIITIAMAFTILGVLGMLGMAAMLAQRSIVLAGTGVLGGLVMLLYVFILNHLRKKGDMNVDYAAFRGPYGMVEVRKKSSIWLTLALGLAILSIIGSLGLIGLGAMNLQAGGTQMLSLGIAGLISSLIYAAVLNFLRTKLDMPVDRAVIVAATGQYLELRKSKSILIAVGLAITVLAALGAFGIGALALTGGLAGLGSTSSYLAAAPYGTAQAGLALGGGMIFLGIMLLIGAAVLNFLRVRVHIEPVQGYVAQPQPAQPYGYQQQRY